jgi:hypothetical protein
MPKDLLYASFKDAPYTSQFVGSTFNELKDAQQVLNQTYDVSKESDSKLAAVARDMAQKAHPKDSKAAQDLLTHIQEKLDTRSKSGRYEDMLHETTNDARQFNVNTGKILAEKQRIDEALKAIDDNPAYTADDKALRKQMTIAHQSGLTYNKNQGLVEGQGFQADRFAPTFDTPKELDDITKGIIPDQTATANGKFVREKTGDGEERLMFKTSNGTKRFVEEGDVKDFVRDILKINPKYQDHLDTKTKEALHLIDPNSNWRNPDPKLYNAIKQQVEKEEVEVGARAMANKYGFTQREKTVKFENDAVDAYRRKLSLKGQQKYDENPRQVIPSTTIQSLKEVDLEDLTKTKKTVSSTTGVGGSGFGSFASSTPTVLERKGKTINELQAEVDDNGSPVYPGLSTITKMVTKNPGESEQAYAKRVNPTYKSFLSKISTHQGTQEGLAASEIEPYTSLVLGPERSEGNDKVRTGGGYFTNSPVWVEQNGEFKKFQNGLQAIEEKALNKKDLSTFSITGLNQNYGDFGGAYEGTGNINGKQAKIFVGGSLPQRRYFEPLSMTENFIAKGEPTTFRTQILDGGYEVPVEIYVEPLPKGKFTVNKKGEFTSITPQVTITDPSGRSKTMDYSKFKAMLVKDSPHKDANQNKQVSNEGSETFKEIPLD